MRIGANRCADGRSQRVSQECLNESSTGGGNASDGSARSGQGGACLVAKRGEKVKAGEVRGDGRVSQLPRVGMGMRMGVDKDGDDRMAPSGG